jgi:hypothetical protein
VSGIRSKLSARRNVESAAELNPLKLHGIDLACQRVDAASLADLGAAWGVNGGYALYAAGRWGLDRVVIVDEDLQSYPLLLERASRTDAVELVDGNFGDSSVARTVGSVDVVTMFDVLLHQVSPADWRTVLALYAPQVRMFLLAGPWWRGEVTVRLPDLGRERYLDVVPDLPVHTDLFDRIDEINPQRNLPWRDCHDVWQWGISDADLRETMAHLGFELVHFESHGPWTYGDSNGRIRNLSEFVNGLYLFSRSAQLK